jgi:hypothetical protein
MKIKMYKNKSNLGFWVTVCEKDFTICLWYIAITVVNKTLKG